MRIAEKKQMKSISKELIGASAIPIILSMLKNGDSYGYEIVQKVKELTNDEITWKEASIYPVLKKLEAGGMIRSYWKIRGDERYRKYYTLLDDGKKQLEQNRHEWKLVYSVFEKLWSPDT
jgi:PadR family transcriptional regulator PadR